MVPISGKKNSAERSITQCSTQPQPVAFGPATSTLWAEIKKCFKINCRYNFILSRCHEQNFIRVLSFLRSHKHTHTHTHAAPPQSALNEHYSTPQAEDEEVRCHPQGHGGCQGSAGSQSQALQNRASPPPESFENPVSSSPAASRRCLEAKERSRLIKGRNCECI